MVNQNANASIDAFKHKVGQTLRGALVIVYGNTIDKIFVADYVRARIKPETEDFKVAHEE